MKHWSKAAAGVAALALAAGSAYAAQAGGQTHAAQNNPYAPRYGHPYRHGAIPMRGTLVKMKHWRSTHASTQATGSNTLYYGGGTSSSSQGNVGVMNSKVKVYLVFYGSGWGTESTNSNGDAVFSGDPDNAAPVAQEMFKDIGTGGETWSAVLTQWCQGISSGASSCPSSTPSSDWVPYQSGGILAGVWEDTSATTPIDATGHQLALEAIKAAKHFGNTTPASNRYAYYVIMSAHGDDPDNYQSSTQGYCAWHDWNGDSSLSGGGAASSSVGDIAFSNQPYNMDVGSSCGVGFVNSPGTLDGWTMTLGHEWQEMVSDTFPAGGWTATSGYENADECAWISSGQGAAANVQLGNGTFTEQSTWSNDTNECDISHAIITHGSGNTVPTASNGSVTTNENTAVSGTLSASDSDADTLTFSIVSQPSNGTVTITNTSTGAFTYTPSSNYSGSDSFTFEATDSAGQASNTATESVTVNPVSTSGCASGFTEYTGSVSAGSDSYQPNNNYYQAAAGYERGRLSGPSGTDFDLYLYQYSYYWGWQVVASSTGNTSSESINYNGSSGYYIWDIYGYSGSGNYTFCLQHP